MRFKTATLGCKVNQYETQWIRAAFLANGWEDADESSDATSHVDLIVVNTCSVTSESDAKSRKTITRFAKDYSNAEIVVVGCYAASDPDAVAKLPNVSDVVSDKRELGDYLRRRGLTNIPSGVDRLSERRRAYVKVQDGCRVGCAYCIIPTTRPYLQSRKIDDVAFEARALASNGYREIVLTGIHLGHYGLDFCTPTPQELEAPKSRLSLEDYYARQALVSHEERVDLASLLRALTDLNLPQVRYRLGSLEAVEVSDRLLRVFEERPDALCPHFHLSMQSGDDDVLKAMKRRWTSAPYVDKCQEIVARLDEPALTTDVIVGFPGETDAQFERTCDVVRSLGFSRVHVFRFSARPGTVAASLTNQVAPEVKKERAAELMRVAKEEREKFAKRFLGRTARVVVETVERREDGRLIARGSSDRYYDVEFPLDERACDVAEGNMTRVRSNALKGDVFLGEVMLETDDAKFDERV